MQHAGSTLGASMGGKGGRRWAQAARCKQTELGVRRHGKDGQSRAWQAGVGARKTGRNNGGVRVPGAAKMETGARWNVLNFLT